ncbi:MAG: endolytic transglycosylase MltG [Myxococcota bacterium]
MLTRILAVLMLLALCVGGYVGYQYQQFITQKPSTEHTEKIITIPRGASSGAIANLLQQEGVLLDPSGFRYYVRLKGAASGIKAGEFRFYTDMTPPQVLEVLVKGEEVTYKVTFPEGYNMRDMAQTLPKAIPFLDGATFLSLARSEELARSLGIPSTNLEGFLFPATYQVTRSMKEKDLVEQMVKQFKATWTPAFDQRAKELGMDMLKVITLASVVEKETGARDEQPTVSSVFHNRLRKGMKLESDPTIIYGLENFDGDIKRADIRRAHPWNTYVIPALPPTPIANPGQGAIEATLYPANTDYLFFVAKGNGEHTFSRTFAEHALKVLEYQIRRRGQAAAPAPTATP